MSKLPLRYRGGDTQHLTLNKQGKTYILFLGEPTYSNAVWELKDADTPQKTEHQQDTRQP
jgi:hypothetical protein